MIDDQKLLDIVQKLLKKSREDEVKWTEQFDDEDDKFYSIKFPESRFCIQVVSPSTQPDYVWVWIVNKNGNPIASLRVEEGETEWPLSLLWDLYHEAERCVMGWDKTLFEIENELQKEGSIGL